jgi:hypothetical protein
VNFARDLGIPSIRKKRGLAALVVAFQCIAKRKEVKTLGSSRKETTFNMDVGVIE